MDRVVYHIQVFLQKVVKRNDLVLATLIVCIIFMMILPLPTWLIDALIASNMCLSAILLMVAMYLPTPLAFSSFPSVLLVTTLFRLAIGIATTRLTDETYVIMVSEIPVSQGRLRPRHLFVKEAPENLQALSIPFESGEAFLPGLHTLWTGIELKGPLSNAGIPFLEPNSLLSYHIALVLKKHAAEFIGIQETRALLTDMENRFPELAKEVQRVMPIHKIAEIMQRLVGEGVSIRNLRAVMEALIEWGQKEKDSVMLTEYVRIALKRHISFRHSAGKNLLPAYLLAPAVEDTVRGAVRQTSGGSYLALDPGTSRQLLENIKSTVGDLSRSIQKPVLLTSMDIRRYLRKMIEQDLYELPVLSYQELTPEVNIQPLARVEL